jgi:diadenosine tetraphosphate (Ap4A) HIT family hydrolase
MSAAPVFALAPRLAATGVPIADLPLCALILKADARWPWVILVPQVADITEWHQLSAADAAQLSVEMSRLSAAIGAEPGVEKVNIAALGNQVPQLHIHIVGRWVGDPAWPEPVFGVAGKLAYTDDALAERRARILAAIGA